MCVSDITTDSRKVTEGCLFRAYKRARVDAHDFVEQVMEAGALATLSEKRPRADRISIYTGGILSSGGERSGRILFKSA